MKSDQSGISEIESDEAASGPARYYTIDGRKVNAPVAGSLVIKVTADGKASKVRF